MTYSVLKVPLNPNQPTNQPTAYNSKSPLQNDRGPEQKWNMAYIPTFAIYYSGFSTQTGISWFHWWLILLFWCRKATDGR